MALAMDLKGKKFGELTAEKYLGKHGWLCKCSCGVTRVFSTVALIQGKVSSCGHEIIPKVDWNLAGKTYKKLTVLHQSPNNFWMCHCECGIDKNIPDFDLRTGKAVNCGIRERHRKNVKRDRVDLTGDTFGEWYVDRYDADNLKYLCVCSCGTQRLIKGSDLVAGKTRSCGHGTTSFIDLTGKTFGELKVNRRMPDGTWECTCSCGNVCYKNGYALRSCETTTCGHKTAFKDLTGADINEWHVNKYIGDGMWDCTCSCGKQDQIHGYTLRAGTSKSCGHTRKLNLLGKDFGLLHVDRCIDGRYYECTCQCGNKIVALGGNIINGNIRSCGCNTEAFRRQTMLSRYGDISTARVNNPRKLWQIEALESRNNLQSAIDTVADSCGYKPTVGMMADYLDVHRKVITLALDKYDLSDSVEHREYSSDAEVEIFNELCKYCDSHNISVDAHNRSLLSGKEVDILIKQLGIGIEYNGSFWHSSSARGKMYHLQKTKECASNKVRLIHIFDYEYNYKPGKNIVMKYLIDCISVDKRIIHARDCSITFVGTDEAEKFLNENHIQGSVNAPIRIGLTYCGELVGIMTFGKPRFDAKYEYELLRLAWKYNTAVVGGAQRLFKAFIKKYCPSTVVSYCDLSKFTGGVYSTLGFECIGISDPGYCWYNESKAVKLYSRYQSQKSKLVAAGLGKQDETEDEIMTRLGYNKVYNCGNSIHVWKSEYFKKLTS